MKTSAYSPFSTLWNSRVQSPSPASAGRRVNARSIAPPFRVASDRGYAREAATLFCESSTLWIPQARDHSMEKKYSPPPAQSLTLIYERKTPRKIL